MISVTITDEAYASGAYYFDADGKIWSVCGDTATVSVLYGIVFVKTPMEVIQATGNYTYSSNGTVTAVRFLEDGGTVTITY
jgi:hypothetical protein